MDVVGRTWKSDLSQASQVMEEGESGEREWKTIEEKPLGGKDQYNEGGKEEVGGEILSGKGENEDQEKDGRKEEVLREGNEEDLHSGEEGENPGGKDDHRRENKQGKKDIHEGEVSRRRKDIYDGEPEVPRGVKDIHISREWLYTKVRTKTKIEASIWNAFKCNTWMIR